MTTELIEKTRYFLSGSDYTKEDVGELQCIIRAHNSLYYNQESPVISDKEYDDLFSLLKKLEDKYNIFDENSPTRRIDILVGNQFNKGAHLSPMISLDNTYDSADIMDFEKRIINIIKKQSDLSYVIELKFDGLGVSLTYKNGKLIKALTRGNGIEGEDITINAHQISSIPKEIPFDSDTEIEIRGEVVMPISAFEDLNRKRLESGDKLFANPRNAASGSLRQIDYRITRDRNLAFFAYSFPYLENRMELNGTGRITSYSQEISLLGKWGFDTSPYLFEARDIHDVVNEISRLTENKPTFAFEIDGLVLKLDDLSLWQALGATEHHPRYAIAYKFPATNVRTQVVDIEHSVGRTGVITPIAHLEPVNVSGVVVSRATLHNYDELSKKDVRIGDSVFIVRAGEVIPEVVSVIQEARSGKEARVLPPEKCPSCETGLRKDEGKVAWYCPNKKGCPAQTLGSLISFVSKHGANIEGLGDKIIELFVEKGIITDFVSIYHLNEHRDVILGFEGFKDKRINNILEEVEGSRNMNLANFFVALGIPQVGKKTAKVLAQYLASSGRLTEAAEFQRDFHKNHPIERSKDIIVGNQLNFLESKGTSEDQDIISSFRGDLSALIWSAISDLSVEELQDIRDIGPIGAHSIVYYFEEHSELVRMLLKELDMEIPLSRAPAESSGSLSGKSFCVTGSFEGLSRDEIHAIIEENGGEVRSSVTGKLDYLIAGEAAGSKLSKAAQLGVAVISLDELYAMSAGNQIMP